MKKNIQPTNKTNIIQTAQSPSNDTARDILSDDSSSWDLLSERTLSEAAEIEVANSEADLAEGPVFEEDETLDDQQTPLPSETGSALFRASAKITTTFPPSTSLTSLKSESSMPQNLSFGRFDY